MGLPSSDEQATHANQDDVMFHAVGCLPCERRMKSVSSEMCWENVGRLVLRKEPCKFPPLQKSSSSEVGGVLLSHYDWNMGCELVLKT